MTHSIKRMISSRQSK